MILLLLLFLLTTLFSLFLFSYPSLQGEVGAEAGPQGLVSLTSDAGISAAHKFENQHPKDKTTFKMQSRGEAILFEKKGDSGSRDSANN